MRHVRIRDTSGFAAARELRDEQRPARGLPVPLTMPTGVADPGARARLLLGVQRLAGNRAAATIARPALQRCGADGKCAPCAAKEEATDQPAVQRFGFFDTLGDIVGDLFGTGDAEELQTKPAAGCTEQPTIVVGSPVPTDIQADSAVEFSQKMTQVLGNPHMAPSFSWNPVVDEKGRVTAVNLTVTTAIIRPRWSGGRLGTGGRDPVQERAIIKKAEDLIKVHEERHRDIARQFAQKAVCATLGKTGDAVEKTIKKVLCDMNKAQEALDAKEGMLTFTTNKDKTAVVDVSVTGTKQSYPCT
jgi:hypothetical protein